MSIEQISSTGTVLHLHRDQQDTTRVLTGTTGAVEGTMTYSPYGTLTGSTGSKTTPLGYDGQYSNTDTGLIYLRAREYDPSTDQFTSIDPIEAITHAPYIYTEDDPLNGLDPSGLAGCGSIAVVSAICNGLQDSGISEAAAEALNVATLGTSTEAAGEVFGFNAECANFGTAGKIGAGLAFGVGLFDGEDEAEVLAEGAESADEANGVTYKARRSSGGDGAEAGYIKERTPDGETVLVVHQVGIPLPGDGILITHQHPLFGPLPGSELFFPDVSP